MKILVISDLHVGTTARAKDFCTEDSGISALADDFINDFKLLVDSEKITATHLLIAGDITNTGSHSEFEIASQRIRDIMELLNISLDNVFFVPGNHDSNWSHEKYAISRNYSDEKIIHEKYTNIRSNSFFSDLLSRSKFSSYYEDPYFTIWESDKIIVVGINSSALDRCDKDLKFGEFDLSTLSVLRRKMTELGRSEHRRLKILLTHHHPKIYSDRTFPDVDLSQMKNAEDFLHFAGESEFDFIIHGHKHIPRFNFQFDSDGFSVNILSAGSFTAQLKDWHNGVANFFHLIEHHDFCPENNFSRGRVLSWSYFTNHKWKRSMLDRDDISHEEYYGHMVSKNKLKNDLRCLILKCRGDGDFVRWNDLTKKEPKLQYCNRKLLSAAFDELSSELEYDLMPSKNDGFVLLWER